MKLETIISIIQTVILLGGFILAIRQVLLLSKQISFATQQLNSQLDWQKKQVTFEYLSKYTNDLKDCTLSLQEKIGLLHENGQTIEFHRISNMLKENSTRTELYNLVAYFEHLAIGIEAKYFDEALIKSSLSNVVVSTYSLVRPYLLYRRHETKIRIGGHFEALANRWKNVEIIKNINS